MLSPLPTNRVAVELGSARANVLGRIDDDVAYYLDLLDTIWEHCDTLGVQKLEGTLPTLGMRVTDETEGTPE